MSELYKNSDVVSGGLVIVVVLKSFSKEDPQKKLDLKLKERPYECFVRVLRK